MLAGIDYGAKKAGTTAVALWDGNQLELTTSQRAQDADAFLKKLFAERAPGLICLDAPLSLPLVYRDPDRGSDYHLRQCDRQVQAMSPLFLGGLTARAMELKAWLEAKGHRVLEAYPKAQAQRLELHPMGYKQKDVAPDTILSKLDQELPVSVTTCPHWHAFDALLALVTAQRVDQGIAESVGNPKEGLIWI
ncbi:MAG: DUF429 domain-containing protein [Leptolyngbya sp. SIO3F4]|nr:DUF429 domain-containing protein [Leptolyngbya sp. SIO3F4]